MTVSLTAVLILVVIAGVCGAVGGALGGASGGVLTSVALGFVGALAGSVVAEYLRLPEPLVIDVDGRPFPIVWSIVGALAAVAVGYIWRGGYLRWRYR
ncbi:MAG TPA: hypothetical protein VHM70_10500 [Polyangiaceae bacterium]|jgi:uncharacterized membrane protein YeaQ/YmgE (transglycosylase-associated protein family)|nr:hypothetical protein [Polyangiaceae bacterium]